VAGRNRTCDASRFKRPLYQSELRPREWARLDSNQQLLVCKTSTLPLSYSPVSVPRQGVEPRPPRSERGVLPLDDPGLKSFVCLARPSPNDVFHATRLPFDPGSPSAGCATGADDVLRGGVLEPEPRQSVENRRIKQTLLFSDLSSAERRGSFSLRRGLDSI
jgi:hypothetical protein